MWWADFATFIEGIGCTKIMGVHPNCIGVTKDAFGLLGITMGFAHGIEYNETGLYTLQWPTINLVCSEFRRYGGNTLK